MKQIGYTLSNEEIREMHRKASLNLPPGSLGLNGPCRCPVCDPDFHKEVKRTPVK